MKRSRFSSHPLALVVLAGLLAACATPSGPARVPNQQCLALGDQARLLVATWPETDRRQIEAAMLSSRILVVRASCDGVTLLPRCTLDGDYRYWGLRPKQQTVSFDSADEAAVNTGRAGTSRPAPVSLDMLRVGKVATTRRSAPSAELRGDCEGATHFVKAVALGVVGPSDAAQGCRALRPGTELPPPECRHLLRLELASLAQSPSRSSASAAHAFCPQGWRWGGAHCIEVKPGRLFECDGDPRECETQCDRGNFASCARLAHLLTHQELPESRQTRLAIRLYGVACANGHAPACFELGLLSATSSAQPEKARQYLSRACDDGIARACSKLAVMDDGAVHALEARTARLDHLLRGCAGGDPSGCLAAARRAQRERLPQEYVLGLLERACLGSVADGCMEAVDALETMAGTRRRVVALLARACQDGSMRACRKLDLKTDPPNESQFQIDSADELP